MDWDRDGLFGRRTRTREMDFDGIADWVQHVDFVGKR